MTQHLAVPTGSDGTTPGTVTATAVYRSGVGSSTTASRPQIRWASADGRRRRLVRPGEPAIRKGPPPVRPQTRQHADAAVHAAGDATQHRAELPRSDTKITSLLSVLTALVATAGLVGALLPRRSIGSWSTWLLGGATVLAWTSLVMLMLLMIPRLRGARFARIARMSTTEAITHYRRCAAHHRLLPPDVDGAAAAPRRRVRVPGTLVHHARQVVNSAHIATRRFRLIRYAGWMEVGAVVLLPFGLLALANGW